MNGKIAFAILIALAFLPLPATGSRLNVYLYNIEENLFMLLILAAVALVALLFLLAYACLREGARLGWQLLRGGFQRTTGFLHPPLAPPEATVRRLP